MANSRSMCDCVIIIPLSSHAGWWFVSNGVDEGWAPCSYLENGGDEEEVAISSLGEDWQSVCMAGDCPYLAVS